MHLFWCTIVHTWIYLSVIKNKIYENSISESLLYTQVCES